MKLFALLLAGASVFFVAYGVLEPIFSRTPMQRRIASLRVFGVGPAQEQDPLLKRLRTAGGEFVERFDFLERLAYRSEPLLDRAATDMRPTEWLAVRLFSSFFIAIAFFLLLRPLIGLLGFLIGYLLGFSITGLLFKMRLARRERVFADELPTTLQLVLSSLRSGFTLQQSIEAAVRDDEGPVADELSRAISESRINGEFEDALARAGERVHSQEMTWLVMAIRLQREVGGSLADVMQTTADTMRERAYLRRHVRSLSAEGRFSAWILVAMPIGIGLLLYITRPEYVSLLFQQPLGLVMIGVAILLMVIGGVWLSATVKIDV